MTVYEIPGLVANADTYFADDMAVVETGKAVINREEPYETPTGEKGWFLTSKFPLQDESGAILGLVFLFVAMWRARWVSVLPAVLMFGGWALSFGAHDLLRASSGYALIALAFVAIGVRIIRMTDREFADGQRS